MDFTQEIELSLHVDEHSSHLVIGEARQPIVQSLFLDSQHSVPDKAVAAGSLRTVIIFESVGLKPVFETLAYHHMYLYRQFPKNVKRLLISRRQKNSNGHGLYPGMNAEVLRHYLINYFPHNTTSK
jgi:hypothetical protein